MIAKSLLVVFCSLGVAAVKISDFITPCSYKDPQLNDCATTQGRALLPHLVPGISEWGIPSMNPHFIPLAIFNKTGGPYYSLFINVTNATTPGWRDVKFKHIKFDTKNVKLDVEWTMDSFEGSGYYNSYGNILKVPVSGKGFGIIKARDIYQTLHIDFVREMRNGVMYLKPVDAVTKVQLKYIHYDIRNLFGNEVLSNIMNAFLNANSLEVHREVIPYIEGIVEGITLGVLADMFAKIPMNEMFKDFE